MTNVTPESQDFVASIKQHYAHFHLDSIEPLLKLYDPLVIFKDPIHEIQGTEKLTQYFRGMATNLTRCQFVFDDEISDRNSAFLKWTMHFEHPRFGSRKISVRGVSHLKFADKIYYHEDIYDLGAMVYDHLPLLSWGTNWVKRQLSGGVR